MTQAKSVALGVSNFNSSGVLSVAGGGTGSSTGYFASGTALVFKQTAAPTGWTKATTDNDAALRVVSGAASTGGSVGFTTAFASQAVNGTVGTSGATTLTSAQIPGHTHGYSGSTSTESAFHTHNQSLGGSLSTVQNVAGSYVVGNANGSVTGNQNSLHTHTYSGTTDAGTPGGGSHTHSGGTFTGTAINLAVKYVDVIVATKD